LIGDGSIANQERALEESIECHVHPPVRHLDGRIGGEPPGERRPDLGARHFLEGRREERIRHHVELEISNHAEQSVTAHRVTE